MAKEGKDIYEIIDHVKELLNSYTVYCIPKTLDYLEKGGRIDKASLIFGNMLDIVPVLSIVNGLMEAVGKIRGRKKIAKKLVDFAVGCYPDQKGSTLIIANGKMDEENTNRNPYHHLGRTSYSTEFEDACCWCRFK